MTPDFLSYWYLFPIGILIATIYTSTGISGANFWIPTYILVVKIDPLVAFWLSLVTVLFGSISGISAHWRYQNINYFITKKYLTVTIPFALAGAYFLRFVDPYWLLIVFGSFVIIYGFYYLFKALRVNIEAKKHNKINYIMGSVGGFMVGMISVGLGKLILPDCISHNKINHHATAIGTTLLIVFITSVAAVLTRLNTDFLNSLKENLSQIINISLFALPGVIAGGQIGPKISRAIQSKGLKIYVSILLILIGVLMFYRVLNFF